MLDETQQINEYRIHEKTLDDYLASFARRKMQFALIFLVSIVIVVSVTLLWPPSYKSSAIILIEQQEIPQDLVRSTVTSYADQRVQVISQRVMTTTNMKAIIDKYDLYAQARQHETMENVLEQMRNDINLNMISADVFDPRTGRAAKATIAFSLAYENQSPRLAQSVANELVSLFLNENLKNRTEMAEEATEFLQDEVEKLSDKVSELEIRLADFKEQNSGSLPEMKDLNIELMDRQERELSEVRRQIRSLEERKIYLQSELSQLSPNLDAFSETGERILGPRDRLKVLETRYLTLSSRYSSDHPDVVSLKKELEALQNEVGGNRGKKEVALRLKEARTELATLQEKYSDDHPDVKKLTRQVSSLEND
ncbi:MAG: sugar transporter, partial [Thiotrichales bacterium]|nr:sugar transporter [Thiotrichales bacterium]